MQIIIYSPFEKNNISSSLGLPEYSYYFVSQSFIKALELSHNVSDVGSDLHRIAELSSLSKDNGESCICLAFSPPNKIPEDVSCPVIPVFAWEFYSFPHDVEGGITEDWRWRIARYGWAITHSNYAAECIKRQVRTDFPVAVIPAPVWDDFAGLYESCAPDLNKTFELSFLGKVIDSRDTELDQFSPITRGKNVGKVYDYLNAPASEINLKFGGVLYLSLLNPNDGRKAWEDMVTAFCWAFRGNSQSTLIIKAVSQEVIRFSDLLLQLLFKLAPFRCRIIMIQGYLDDPLYKDLLKSVHYVVNVSHGEGQCLPIMEGMSAGTPAIAPNHTGLADYVNEDNGFIVESDFEPAFWPPDPKQELRTLQYRIDWDSLCSAYKSSHRLIYEQPLKYKAMSQACHEQLREHCSRSSVSKKLLPFLKARSEESRRAHSSGQAEARKKNIISKLLNRLSS